MQIPFTGGCVCGEVQYECTAAPLLMLKCHCRDCQRTSGGPYVPVVVVPLQAFRITKGALQHHSTPSLTGGHNNRGFCPKCGSRLTGAENPARGFIGVAAGTLDDPSWFEPKFDIFTEDAQSWDLMDPDLPKYEQLMPRRG